MIELSGVRKAYATHRGEHVVLDGISARFETGWNVGILGRSGAGKSTLLRIVGGIELPDSGEVISKARLSWPLGLAGGFNGSLTAEENCRFVARIYGEDVDRVVDFTRDFAEVGDYFYMPIKTYSSGMKARVAFGLSMALDFEVYLIDETTAVGDHAFQKKCKDAFAERRARASVIMVSHNMKTIREYCDHAAVLRHGTLTLFDSVEEAARHYEGAA